MKIRKIAVLVAVVLVVLVGAVSLSFAATDWKTPAEILSGLTGKSVDEILDGRQSGLSLGEQATAAGQLDAFKEERLAQMRSRLDEAVQEDVLTQEEADTRYQTIVDRQALCTGTGNPDGTAAGNGLCGGAGSGLNREAGSGMGRGRGMGLGKGLGNGLGNGSCNGLGSGNGN